MWHIWGKKAIKVLFNFFIFLLSTSQTLCVIFSVTFQVQIESFTLLAAVTNHQKNCDILYNHVVKVRCKLSCKVCCKLSLCKLKFNLNKLYLSFHFGVDEARHWGHAIRTRKSQTNFSILYGVAKDIIEHEYSDLHPRIGSTFPSDPEKYKVV